MTRDLESGQSSASARDGPHRGKPCVFCEIIAGRVQVYSVYEDERTLAFLDHAPLMPGHVLVVPKTHYPAFEDLPRKEVGPLFEIVQRLAIAGEKALKADGAFLALNIRISQSVPHVHVHVVPRRKGDGLFGRNFMWIRRPYPSEQAALETQRAIQTALAEA